MSRFSRLYGLLGVALILIVIFGFFFDNTWILSNYFPFAWIGSILFLDSLVFLRWKRSLISTYPRRIIAMFITSVAFWMFFESANELIGNWSYIYEVQTEGYWKLVVYFSFATVIPAFFEVLNLMVFDLRPISSPKKLPKIILSIFILLGVLCAILPFIFPNYCYPLIWLCFFLILDPLNYNQGFPSILYAFKIQKWDVICYLVIAGLAIGFLWELWNYFAGVRWQYHVPFFEFVFVFNMPIFGYLGYIPFGFEIFAFYYFMVSLFRKAQVDKIY